jgi:hypothetical protein
MKTTALSLIAALAMGGGAIAAGVSDYQVTGNVTDVNDSMITVMKGKEKFEIARDSSTKTEGEVKTGDKATVHYKMTAIRIEAKAAKKDAKAAASPAASVKK